jgi:hypothetical protein
MSGIASLARSDRAKRRESDDPLSTRARLCLLLSTRLDTVWLQPPYGLRVTEKVVEFYHCRTPMDGST